MKSTFKQGKTGAIDRMKILGFLILSAIVAMVWVFVQTGSQAAAGHARLYAAGDQMVLSKDFATHAQAAVSGDAAAIAKLQESRNRFAHIYDAQLVDYGAGSGMYGNAVYPALEKLGDQWRAVRMDIDALLESQSSVTPSLERGATLSGRAGGLFDAAKNLHVVLGTQPGHRFINQQTGYGLGALALLLMFFRAIEQRSRERQVARENAASQRAIARLLEEMDGLAEGDLTVHTTVGDDFTGSIADSINVTVDSLRGLVKTINDTSRRLSSSVQETDEIAGNLLTASKQQSRDIGDASAAIKDMSRSMNDVSSNAGESSRVAMRSVEVARNGGEAVQRTKNGMDTIREHIQETSKRIKRLGESSQEIGDIVELINDIAEQTNILALNASIQAAMAGEAGRGFAVVADEVQRLAERSANATRQIEALVKTIQADTNEAVISMEKSTAGVVNGAQLAEAAGSSLEEIESISEQLAGLIQNISNSSQNQAEAASELTATIQGIQHVTTQATTGTEQTSRSIGTLSRLAQDLDTSVAGFKLPK